MSAMRCKDCAFYVVPEYLKPYVGSDDEVGQCRRFPRTIEVSWDWWCGEFRNRVYRIDSEAYE